LVEALGEEGRIVRNAGEIGRGVTCAAGGMKW
jgi:hypothetical protein